MEDLEKTTLANDSTNADYGVGLLDLGLGLDPRPVQQDQAAVNKLSTGLLAIFQPGLEKIKGQLDELTMKQSIMILQLAEEGNKISPERSEALGKMQSKIELYTAKLLTIKKDMYQTAEKVTLLKRRALWLQAAKQKEAMQLECQKELQLQREQELIAKPMTGVNSPTSSAP